MRVLVTASRDWDDAEVIALALIDAQAQGHPVLPTLVVGACPTGADHIAYALAAGWGWPTERHPADWDRYGKRAGYLRNAEMVDAGADVCLAFIRNSSRGATMTADLAERAGIPVRRWTS